MAVQAEIKHQRETDEKRGLSVGLLSTRLGAVFDAADASGNGEEGGYEALRQTLVDLAAAAEGLADNLPPPLQWKEADERRAVLLAKRRAEESPPPPPPAKLCTGPCGKVKPLTAFGRNKANPDGRLYSCRDCRAGLVPESADADADPLPTTA